MKKTISLTKAGKLKLEEELQELISQRPAIAERLATARSFGDLSENQEYSDARAEQKTVENRIEEIEDILKNAKLIKSSSTGKITMGSHVTINLGGKEQAYDVVGSVEADPLNGKISDQSPIGQALLGRQAGDEFALPNGKTGTIVSVA